MEYLSRYRLMPKQKRNISHPRSTCMRDNLKQFRSCLCRIHLPPTTVYTSITEAEYNKYVGKIKNIDFTPIYEG